MIAGRAPTLRQGKRGFTLMEVMLTLGLLVIIATLSWPSMVKAFSNQRLRTGADQIRTQWVVARVEAMRSDQTYVFRYTPQSNRYCVSCQALPEGSADTELATGNAAAQNSGSAQPAASGQSVEGTLPEGITFAGSETDSDLRAAVTANQQGLSNQTSAGLSEPIFFYPDGTASAARLLLQNERGRGILLSLRGLTGVVTVGDVQVVDAQAVR